MNAQLNRATERYRAAWRALSNLDPEGSWGSRLRELRKEDISGPGKEDGESHGHYIMSWIISRFSIRRDRTHFLLWMQRNVHCSFHHTFSCTES